MADLVITDLHVDVETESGPKPILHGVNLTIKTGEIHAIMGPNGSGKSTMAYALAGHPKYTITSGSATLDGVELTGRAVHVVARPSGTEPKLKCYLEVRLGVEESQDVPAARATAAGLLERLRAEMATALGV